VPRADATRNRNQLLEVATRVFVSADDTQPSTCSIAGEAGVGIATLYRRFPTRESVVDAVYRDQVARLTDVARRFVVCPRRGSPSSCPRSCRTACESQPTSVGSVGPRLTRGRLRSADLAHAWSAEWQVRSKAEQVDLRLSGSVARVNSVLTRGAGWFRPPARRILLRLGGRPRPAPGARRDRGA
jgi:AcrR family transcriptional regulator